jgi:DHA1 family inner membrane transport protein
MEIHLVKEKISIFFGNGLQVIGALFFARLIVDSGNRLFFPFLPQISEGLMISITGLSWLLFLSSSLSILGPIFASLAEKYGFRKIMIWALFSQAIGSFGIILITGWWSGIPIIFLGIGSLVFLPAQQAYISDQIEYAKRGRALATLEISWSLVGIIVLPLVGWLIDVYGWSSPLLILGVLSLVSIKVIENGVADTIEIIHSKSTFSKIFALLDKPNIRASISVAFFLLLAVGSYTTVWGIWLNAKFGFSTVEIGVFATLIGFGELVGVFLSWLIIDRIGKRFGSLLGIAINAFLFLLLLIFKENLPIIKAILILLGLAAEFTIVSLIPLYSDQARNSRMTVFSLISLGHGFGRGLGGLITASLWESGYLSQVFVFSFVCLSISYSFLMKFLYEKPADHLKP